MTSSKLRLWTDPDRRLGGVMAPVPAPSPGRTCRRVHPQSGRAESAMLGQRSPVCHRGGALTGESVGAQLASSLFEQIDDLYKTAGVSGALPAEIETAAMTRLRKESHARMLGNGMCTRPVELECRMESACETCAYFRTGPEFVPVLLRQRDHAREHGRTDRADLFDGLINQVSQAST